MDAAVETRKYFSQRPVGTLENYEKPKVDSPYYLLSPFIAQITIYAERRKLHVNFARPLLNQFSCGRPWVNLRFTRYSWSLTKVISSSPPKEVDFCRRCALIAGFNWRFDNARFRPVAINCARNPSSLEFTGMFRLNGDIAFNGTFTNRALS